MFQLLLFAVAFLLVPVALAADADRLEEVVVTAQFRRESTLDIPASVEVIDARTVQTAAVQHFEELAQLVPDLNYSGEGNRARYFQIRGVGERAQYEGAPNPSVGFVIDDVDFSSIGGIATLWDVDSIEVLRGPQGTRYGANALAGLIYVRTASPPRTFGGRVQLQAGGDGARGAAFSVGGPLGRGSDSGYLLDAQNYRSNGFRHNVYLNRNDTQGRDETTLRGKLRWARGDDFRVQATAFYVDLDDGYDAFAVDNGFDTYSDHPGRDAQRSVAGALRVESQAPTRFSVLAITGAADSHIDFSFDADWGNAGYWAPYTYDYTSATRRNRNTFSEEIRLTSKPGRGLLGGRVDWVSGLYWLRLREDNFTHDQGVYADPFYPEYDATLDASVKRAYRADSTAVYGEMDVDLARAWTLSGGLRLERRSTDYHDSDGNRFGPGETMWGGQLTLTRQLGETRMIYARAARGYKAGGFNLGLPADGSVTDDQRLFGAEHLINYELGLKGAWMDGRLENEAVLFWSRRADQQIRISTQLDPNNPASFVFYTDNAGRGRNAGLELTSRWQATPTLQLYASAARLATRIDDFGSNTALEGRDQAHAPRYSYATGLIYQRGSGVFARLDAAGKAAFYFSDSHDQRSSPYTLFNGRVGYDGERWSAYLWGRNLTDERYAVRGFYFGNEPPDFPDRLYVKWGDRRQFGVTLRYRFGGGE